MFSGVDKFQATQVSVIYVPHVERMYLLLQSLSVCFVNRKWIWGQKVGNV